MKKFKCTVTKETTMEIEIDDTVWTPEEIKLWNCCFYEANDLAEVVEHLAKMKAENSDGQFIEGFGIPMIDGKKPLPYLKDTEVTRNINICNQDTNVSVDVSECRDV